MGIWEQICFTLYQHLKSIPNEVINIKETYTMIDSMCFGFHKVMFFLFPYHLYDVAKRLYRKSTCNGSPKCLILCLAITIWNAAQSDTPFGIETNFTRNSCSYPSLEENYCGVHMCQKT